MKNIDVTVYPDEIIKNKELLIAQVLKIRGKWSPATFNGFPTSNFMKMQLRQDFKMGWEQQIQNEKFESFTK